MLNEIWKWLFTSLNSAQPANSELCKSLAVCYLDYAVTVVLDYAVSCRRWILTWYDISDLPTNLDKVCRFGCIEILILVLPQKIIKFGPICGCGCFQTHILAKFACLFYYLVNNILQMESNLFEIKQLIPLRSNWFFCYLSMHHEQKCV